MQCVCGPQNADPLRLLQEGCDDASSPYRIVRPSRFRSINHYLTGGELIDEAEGSGGSEIDKCTPMTKANNGCRRAKRCVYPAQEDRSSKPGGDLVKRLDSGHRTCHMTVYLRPTCNEPCVLGCFESVHVPAVHSG